MTAKEFLSGKTLTAIEFIEDLTINLVVDKAVYGLSVDTSSITAGTKLTRTEEFEIDGDTLTSGDITLDLSETDMLSSKKQ
jgi:hypothetical protein